MAKRSLASIWARAMQRGTRQWTRAAGQAGARALAQAWQAPGAPAARRKGAGAAATPAGGWLSGVALGPAGARRYRQYRPPGVRAAERLPLLVMLHGCGQDAAGFAASTRMNRIAARERFLVLYPEQDRLAHAQGCWNWFDTRRGRAQGEAALVLAAVDQVCTLYPADRARVAVLGLSAGASLAALLAAQHPARFKAVVMHSGVPPGAAHSVLTALPAMQGRRQARPAAALAPPGPVGPALLVIHGRQDGVVAPANGRAAAQAWAAAAGASAAASRIVQRGRRHAATVTDYRLGRRCIVTLVEVDQLGHAWSGGAARQPFGDPKGPDVSRLAWAFCRRQFDA